ncbi:MAG: hypothetical protein IT248_01940 [Chitinophagaceae bacterium]|nr:hypothetical protein [Chitinophagaceae bacterium]
MNKFIFIALLLIHTCDVNSQTLNAFALKGSKWKTKKISVSWENPNDKNKMEREWVKTAIKNSWEKYADIEFTGWGTSTANSRGIRIRISDDSYGPHVKFLGNQLDGLENGMVLNFTFNNWSPTMKNRRKDYIIAIAVHEFGHALGFSHEHNRKDCHFCDDDPQGSDGDYYITTCDLYSVMNYCNPSYSNWGKLSAGDIIGVTTLYGKKQSTITPSVDKAVTIAHTFRDLTEEEQTQKPNLKKFIKIYVSGSATALNSIQNVTYELHPSFTNRYISANEAGSNFGVGIYVWGMFEIKATIKFKDGTQKIVSHYLSFDELPNIPEVENFNMNYTVRNLSAPERNQSSGNQKEISVFIESSQAALNKISYVEYKLHPTFNPQLRKSKERKNNFKIKFTCWGQFTISASIIMKDGSRYEIEKFLAF